MNNILKQIIPSFCLAVFFTFPAAVSAQSLTVRQLQQINSGLFRSNSQDFFDRGNRQLEREIGFYTGITGIFYCLRVADRPCSRFRFFLTCDRNSFEMLYIFKASSK
jgi:hypothetical protein